MTTYAYWTLGVTAWLVIGFLMLKYVWKSMHGGLAMLGHDVPNFAILLLVFAIVFWPYPPGVIHVLVIWPMELWDKTRNWRYKMRTLLRTGKWPRPAKKEDPKRTNFVKVKVDELTDEQVEALMICIEYYVLWAEHNPKSDDEQYIAKRTAIAQRLAGYLKIPQRAVAEMILAGLANDPSPKLWHKSQD